MKGRRKCRWLILKWNSAHRAEAKAVAEGKGAFSRRAARARQKRRIARIQKGMPPAEVRTPPSQEIRCTRACRAGPTTLTCLRRVA